jgi:deazaflavin-dependent oxidoreductase (nitroreductase family)
MEQADGMEQKVMAGFDRSVLEAALAEREVELTTYGRKSGKPSRRVLWIASDGEHLFVRCGGGFERDWPRNLLANGRAELHIAGMDVPVQAVHVTDIARAREVSGLVIRKYGSTARRSAEDAPPTPGERATFELAPDDSAAASRRSGAAG